MAYDHQSAVVEVATPHPDHQLERVATPPLYHQLERVATPPPDHQLERLAVVEYDPVLGAEVRVEVEG